MLLTAVDRGLGACFFGLPVDCIDTFREAFGVPDQYLPHRRHLHRLFDETDDDARTVRRVARPRRRPQQEVVHRQRWTVP
jgi:hypothetical protein